jgi:hypothetical protein
VRAREVRVCVLPSPTCPARHDTTRECEAIGINGKAGRMNGRSATGTRVPDECASRPGDVRVLTRSIHAVNRNRRVRPGRIIDRPETRVTLIGFRDRGYMARADLGRASASSGRRSGYKTLPFFGFNIMGGGTIRLAAAMKRSLRYRGRNRKSLLKIPALLDDIN